MNTLLSNISLGGYILAMLLYASYLIFKSNRMSLFARLGLILGFLSQTCEILIRWHAANRPPFSNMYESLIVFSWALVFIYLVVEITYKLRIPGCFVAIVALLIVASASGFDSTIRPLMPALQSNWLVVHVLVCFIGYAAFAVSCICSIIYLTLCRGKSKDNRASLLTALDMISYRTITFGFLFLSLGIVSGAVWANNAWGRYWGWDPKETWALITWFIYAFYWHMRLLKGWKGIKGAWLSIVGFVAVLFTYVGVSYLMSSLHSYAR